ncbi:MAG: hypothetical protein C5B56_05520 [Proteobacteria bacterium]|nr:MAG: hypothetical protein C5B56_05520 [Pseudomonadota bacterium]
MAKGAIIVSGNRIANDVKELLPRARRGLRQAVLFPDSYSAALVIVSAADQLPENSGARDVPSPLAGEGSACALANSVG